VDKRTAPGGDGIRVVFQEHQSQKLFMITIAKVRDLKAQRGARPGEGGGWAYWSGGPILGESQAIEGYKRP